MYEISDLHAELDPQLPELEVKKKIQSGLKTNILDELLKMLDVLTNLGNFIDLIKRIDKNLYKYNFMYQ